MLVDKIIKDYEIKLVEPGCAPGSGRWGVLVTPDQDISAVFPYLNAVLPNARYDHENKVLIWEEQGQHYALRPKEIRVANVLDLTQGIQIVNSLIEQVNKIWAERESITPRYAERKIASLIDLFKLLPGTNCGQCGHLTCMAYAADLRKHTVTLEACVPLAQAEYAEKREKLKRLLAD